MIMDCYICGYLFPEPTANTLLNQKTNFSCTPIINILDKLFTQLDLKFTDHCEGNINCCQECLSKINEYDYLLTTVGRIESEFKTIYYSRIAKNQQIKNDIDFFDTCGGGGGADDARSIVSDSINILDDIKNEEFFQIPKVNTDDDEKKKNQQQKSKRKLKSLQYFQCEKCKQIFNTKLKIRGHLKNHFQLSPHNGKENYPCQFCGKIFLKKSLLAKHTPIHTGERPIQCEICGKRYHSATFAKHKLVHMDIAHKKCTLCPKTFTTMSHLKRHIRSHTGEKPFLCTICGKSFAEKYNLSSHLKSHPGSNLNSQLQKNHTCQICHIGFERPAKLNEHLALKHNVVAITDLTSRNLVLR